MSADYCPLGQYPMDPSRVRIAGSNLFAWLRMQPLAFLPLRPKERRGDCDQNERDQQDKER
jgi:hypothetical protein